VLGVIDFLHKLTEQNLQKYKIIDEKRVQVYRGSELKGIYHPKQKWIDFIIEYDSYLLFLIEAKTRSNFEHALEQFEESITIIQQYYQCNQIPKKEIRGLVFIYQNESIFRGIYRIDHRKIIWEIDKNQPLKVSDFIIFGYKE